LLLYHFRCRQDFTLSIVSVSVVLLNYDYLPAAVCWGQFRLLRTTFYRHKSLCDAHTYLTTYLISRLLFSTRSTDFDVHRHWKALTRSLQLQEWYFDNDHVPTVHTLDYPPSFAFFEYVWSTNVVTNWLVQHDYIDADCLALESSTTTTSSSSSTTTTTLRHGYQNPSTACIAFMRSTVIISDIVLWFGAWMIASAVVTVGSPFASSNDNDNDDKIQKFQRRQSNSSSNKKKKKKWTIFALIVANPGLLWLDSVHFQYNGFLLGILLLSLTCLVRGNHHHHHHHQFHYSHTATTSATTSRSTILFHVWHILAAVLFAFLLTLKHLYMTLSLWYFAYLLRRYCFVHQTMKTEEIASKRMRTTSGGEDDNVAVIVVVKPMRLLILGVVTATTLVVPFLPFFLSSSSSSSSNRRRTSTEQARRIFERLFPFGRGLVHDYWAGNVWAIYMAMTKIVPKLKALEPSPMLVICLLVLALVPGAVGAWKAAALASKADVDGDSSARPQASSKIQCIKAKQQEANYTNIEMANELFWSSLTYTALAAFMIAYHVHEKAILTTLVPMTIWLCIGGYHNHQDDDNASKTDKHHPPWLLLWRTMAFGLLGLCPLLFHPTEVLLKVFSFAAYLVILSSPSFQSASSPSQSTLQKRPPRCFSQQRQQVFVWLLVTAVLLILECLPIRYFGRYEFVPLAITSLTTAMGLLVSFLELSWKMVQLVAETNYW
jgi:alpha-1,3-glucosyltransferase